MNARDRMKELDMSACEEIVMKVPVTFFTGKGGVGKTTIATLATRAAISRGERVLFISLYRDRTTDVLLDCEETGGERTKSRTIGCDVYFLTPEDALERYLSRKRMGVAVKKLARSGLLRMIAHSVPGIRELVTVSEIRSLSESKEWDRIIVDAPSTGHALSLFSAPDDIISLSNEGTIFSQADSAHSFLHDPAQVHVVVITRADVLPLSECHDLVFALEENLHLPIAGVIVNAVSNEQLKSRHIDTYLRDIYVPLYFHRDNMKKKKRGFLSRFATSHTFPASVHSHLTLEQKNHVVLGTGGVGKTTLSAAIAYAHVQEGKKVALLTIDPARRLGTALGFSDPSTSVSFLDEHLYPASEKDAQLSVFQLDAQHEFLELLRERLPAAAFEKVEDNSFVARVSRLGMVTDYMALAAMHRLTSNDEYDIVVIDTPPLHNMDDLFSAPDALKRMTSSPIYKALVGAGGIAATATLALTTLLKPLRTLVGQQLFDDAREFLTVIRDANEGVSELSREVMDELLSPTTTHTVVCRADSASLSDGKAFFKELQERAAKSIHLVINGIDTSDDNALDELESFSNSHESGTTAFPVINKDNPLDIIDTLSKKILVNK